ncbi:hypothetical protein M1563_05150 [Patescibacteria group bacterium]|nr:hypothetical protein [Patescibacteria group bacterium]MCL5409411.1 hypothetical protein [Patescibacteria group bacterium]
MNTETELVIQHCLPIVHILDRQEQDIIAYLCRKTGENCVEVKILEGIAGSRLFQPGKLINLDLDSYRLVLDERDQDYCNQQLVGMLGGVSQKANWF